jgi:hypothetical protein
MMSKFVIALAALGILVALAASDARTLDRTAAPAPEVLATVSDHAGMRPLAPSHGVESPAAPAVQAATALATGTDGDSEPKNWVLLTAGVYLIGTVLRRRARSTTI